MIHLQLVNLLVQGERDQAPEQDSDSDMVHHPDQQNRNRQKKFAKNFKGLPLEETVHKSKIIRLFISI